MSKKQPITREKALICCFRCLQQIMRVLHGYPGKRDDGRAENIVDAIKDAEGALCMVVLADKWNKPSPAVARAVRRFHAKVNELKGGKARKERTA